MNKIIPLQLSLAQRLAAAQPETRFCGFCRTERAAVEELKAAMALSPTGRLPSQPEPQGFAASRSEGMEPVPRPGQKLVEADFSQLEARVAAHFEDCDEGGLERQAISAMPGPARQPVDYDYLRELIAAQKKDTTQGAWDSMCSEAGGVIEDVLADLDQAQATIKEMGELIDQQEAEMEAMRALLKQIRTGVHHRGWKIGIGLGSEIERLVPGIEK